MPDFDPSHIITIAALMEGGNEVNWQKGEARLKQLKDSVAAFYSTDAQSQDLMKTGQGPVQVMLSVNAYHLQEQGIPVKVVQPTDYPGVVGIDTMAVMAGTKKADAAHQFINLALSKEIQTRAGQGAARGARQPGGRGAGQPQGPAGHLPSAGRVEGARLHHERRGPGEEPAGLAGVVHGEHRQEVRLLLVPAVVVLAVFAAALGVAVPVERARVRPGVAPDGRPHAGELPRACWPPSTSARSGTRSC